MLRIIDKMKKLLKTIETKEKFKRQYCFPTNIIIIYKKVMIFKGD